MAKIYKIKVKHSVEKIVYVEADSPIEAYKIGNSGNWRDDQERLSINVGDWKVLSVYEAD